MKRNIKLVNWCCMCKRSGEFVDDLLYHYSVAYDLWSFGFYTFEVL